jgi:hypothetical protein
MPADGTADPRLEQLPAIIEPAAAPSAPDPNIPPEDIDDRAVWEAEREVAEADRQRGVQQQPPRAPSGPPPAARPQATVPAPAVPPQRLREEAQRRRAAELEVARLRGQVEALRGQQQAAGRQPAAAAPAAQPTIEQQISHHQANIAAAAARFDRGEMTLVDFKALETRATDQILALRERNLFDQMQRLMPKPVPGVADQALMQQQIAELEAAHPLVTHANDGELLFLKRLAMEEAAALGRPIATGPAGDMRLRKAVAELADTYMPRWYPNLRGSASQPAAAAQPQQQQQHQPPAQRQQPTRPSMNLGAKVEAAARHPPNLATAGSAAEGPPSFSPDAINAMSEDEVMALPPQIRDRYLYG